MLLVETDGGRTEPSVEPGPESNLERSETQPVRCEGLCQSWVGPLGPNPQHKQPPPDNTCKHTRRIWLYIQMLPFMTKPEARVEHRCLASGI